MHMTRPLAAWMARTGAPLLADEEVIIPVRLHRRRLFARRFDQAAALAFALPGVTRAQVAADILVLQRATPPQGRLSAAARRRNLRGAGAGTVDALTLARVAPPA